MKKITLLCLALILLLAGCTQNAALLKNPIKNSLDRTSYASESSLSLQTNLEIEDEMGQFILEILKDGLIIQTSQVDEQNGQAIIKLQNPSAVLGSSLWPYELEPTIEMMTDSEFAYMKSSIDEKYLALKTPEIQGTQDEIAAFVKEAMQSFIEHYDFTFKNVENLGEEQLTLGDGTVTETTHIQVKLDLLEGTEALIYTLEKLADYEELDALVQYMSEQVEADVMETDAESVRTMILDLANELKQIDMASFMESGWNGQLTLDFWISPEEQIVQDGITLSIQAPGEMFPEFSQETIQFEFSFASQYWDLHDYTISIPDLNEVITDEQLIDSPELIDSFAFESPIRLLAETLIAPDFGSEDNLEPIFDDVGIGHTAFEEITTLYEFGIIEGTGNNQFSPAKNISRAEFIKMIASFYGLEPTDTELPFVDSQTTPSWAKGYVAAAYEAGFVEGNGDGTLRPNAPITRSEMVTILVKALELPLEEAYAVDFIDENKIPVWAVPYVKTATTHGLVQGRQHNQFAPTELTNRGEAAIVIYRSIFDLSY